MGQAIGAAVGLVGLGAPFLPPPFNVIAAVGSFALSAAFAGFGRQPSRGNIAEFDIGQFARDRSVILRSAIEPRRRVLGTDKVGSMLAYGNSKGSQNKQMHIAAIFCDGPVKGIKTIYINDQPVDISSLNAEGWVTSGRFANKLQIFPYRGLATQQVNQMLRDAFGEWTDDHRLRGICYAAMKLIQDDKAFPTGPPNVSAVIEGEDTVIDVRDQSTGWTNNWALCTLHYLRADWGFGLEDDEWNLPSFAAAANLSDELVGVPGGGTQARYSCDGVISLDKERRQVAEGLLSAGNGYLPYLGGAFDLFGGAWYGPPTLGLDESDLAGRVKLGTATDLFTGFNRVIGKFVDPNELYEFGDFPPVENATYEAEDGQRITKRIELPFTNDAYRAQRIALQLVRQTRFGATLNWPGMPSVVDVPLVIPVNVSLKRGQYQDKAFTPLEYSLAPNDRIDLLLRETDQSIFDFDPADIKDPEQPNPPTPPAPELGPVQNLSATQVGDEQVQISWDEIDSDKPVQGYYLGYGPPGSTAEDSTLIDEVARGTQIFTATIPPGSWVVFIRARDASGNLSMDASSVAITVVNFYDIVFGEEQFPSWPGVNLTNLGRSWSGFLYPLSRDGTAVATFEQLFETYAHNPQPESVVRWAEQDVGFDAGRMRAYFDAVAALGPGETGSSPALGKFLDWRLAAGFYKGWQPWPGLGQIDARYVLGEIRMDNTGEALRRIERAKLVLDVRERTLSVRNVTVAAAGSRVNFPGRFFIPPNVAPVADQPGGAVRFGVREAVDETGFTFKIVEADGTLVGGTGSYTATGPLATEV